MFRGTCSHASGGWTPKILRRAVGPIINSKQLASLVAKVEQAKTMGARLLLDGEVQGQLFPPHVVRGRPCRHAASPGRDIWSYSRNTACEGHRTCTRAGQRH